MGREKRPPNLSRPGERALRAPGMLDAICHEFIRAIGDWRLAIGDWRLRLGAKIVCDSLGRFVATETVPNRGPASVARLS